MGIYIQTIYEPKGKAKEYGDLALNIYTGCPHRCVYCYVPSVLRRDTETFHTCVEPRQNIVEETRKRLARGDIKDKQIFLCFTCDPFPIGFDHTATYDIIQAIKDTGNHVIVLTKGAPDMYRLLQMLDGNDKFGVTISGGGDMEPNAADEITRLRMVRCANVEGIPTFVSCEPVYNPDTVYGLIRDVDCIDEYKIGKLNYAPSSITWGDFGRECEMLCIYHGRNYNIKQGLRAEMEKGV